MVTIIPAILAKSEEEFRFKLEKVWGLVDRVQLDVIDRRFRPEADQPLTETVMPEVLKLVDTSVEFDAHLMVESPSKWVSRCKDAGISRVFGQVEKMTDKVAFVADAQFAGMKVGLAYDIDTPLDGLEEVIADLDAVLLMSVKAGKGGQEFQSQVLEKIKQVRKLSKEVVIVVDGGLNEENIKKCLAAEWEEEIEEGELLKSAMNMEFVVGGHLLGSDNIKEELVRLQRLHGHD